MFICHRKDNTKTAHQYLCGLIQSNNSNIERMEEIVEDSNYESMQQFISDSPWDYRKVMDRTAFMGNELLGGVASTSLIIDETAFQKKGVKSVAVVRQYNGRLGKIENSQVAVFGVLSSGERSVPVDARLFVPDEWVEDPERCRKVKIPEDRICKKTKIELALEIVKHQRNIGSSFEWVGADGLYGNSYEFCCNLEDIGENFLMDIHSNRLIFLEDPKPIVPEYKGSGKQPKKLKAQISSVRVDRYIKELSSRKWKTITVRETTKGHLVVEFHSREVWLWDGEEEKARKWLLLVQRDQDGKNVKYSICNISSNTSDEILAEKQSQRYWIERSFEDGKKEVGMGDYQIRGWLGWHHHIALVMMAMLFMTKQRMLYKKEIPLLSCYDIKILLVHFLPKKNQSTDMIFKQMQVRHKKRQASIDSANRVQEKKINDNST